MHNINFVSNPAISFFKMYYDSDIENECIDVTPETIPEIIIPALSGACGSDLVLVLKVFIDMNDPEQEYVHAIISTWDGITAVKRGYRLYADGKYERLSDEFGMLQFNREV